MLKRLEVLSRRALRLFLGLVLRTRPGGPVDPSRLRRLLVVRVDPRVGNALLTTPLLRALRQGLPGVRIDWLIAPRMRALVEGLPYADRLLPFDRQQVLRHPLRFLGELRALRRERYDAVIEATHYDAFSLTSALLALASGAPIRIGHDRGEASAFFTHLVTAPATARQDVRARLQLLGPLGVAPDGLAPDTSAGLAPDVAASAAGMLAAAGVEPRRFALTHCGTRKLDRRIPVPLLAGVLRRVHAELGLRSLISWGPGEEPLARELAAAAGAEAALCLPPTDLQQLAALLRQSALLITGDTGPMHLGVACGTPTVALFTVPELERWGHPEACYRAIPLGEPAATGEAVVRAAGELLAATQPVPGA